MKEDSMLKCLIAFILGWLLCRMMGNGFRIGGYKSSWTDLYPGQDGGLGWDPDIKGNLFRVFN